MKTKDTIAVLLSLPKTIYFNIKYLPLSQALKLPIWLHYSTKVKSCYRGGG